MASTSYLCVGGVEITNDCRVTAYMKEGLKPATTSVRDCCCTDLNLMLGDPAYRLPHLDDAPWWDPAVPESAEFGGFIVTSITGLDGAQTSRQVTDRTGDGAVIGRRRIQARQIVVTGLLTGSSCCGVDYGLQWLTAALQGSLGCAPGSGCGGDDLTYLACCPTICEDAPDFVSYEECAAPHIRTLREVALTAGPEVISKIGGACSCCPACPMYEVQFTLTAGRPHAYRQPVTVVSGATWDPDEVGECITWVTGDTCVDTDECPQPGPCPLDPNCPLPDVPDLPVPDNPCVCDPLVRTRMCVSIPAGQAPTWFDAVTDLEIYAGVADLRSVRIRFYPNPLGLSVDGLDACGFCAEVNITYLPGSSTIRLDGTRRMATVTCPGREETPAGSIVYGPDGGPLEWPVLECGVAYIVCLEADAATVSADSSVTIRTVVREGA